MKIAIGSDHAGFKAKSEIIPALLQAGHKVHDMGAFSEDSTDYPDYAALVGTSVARGRADRGILICGTGIGMCIAANKVRGVRAGVVWSLKTAVLAAEHNGANVLCLSGRLFKPALLTRMAKVWLATPFAGGRHSRRLRKITRLEKNLS